MQGIENSAQMPWTVRALSAVRRRRLARRGREGMTLVEIMIVVIIMALIATAVAVAVLPQLEKARVKRTRSDAVQVKSAVTLWLADNPNECPTVQQLVETHNLDGSKSTKDAWDRDFTIECADGDITVVSPGPDGEMGTEDDIRG